MTAAELGFGLWLGEGIPFAHPGAQPAFSFGARLRYRPTPQVAGEIAAGRGPTGTDVALEGLSFVGAPTDDVVLAPVLGVGARFADGVQPLALVGFAADLVLFPVLDLRVDARLTWAPGDGLGLILAVGPQLHTVRGFDEDHDGLADRVDRCDSTPEDPDGYLDADGCPDPDNDHDGVLDTVDVCVATPEDHDGFLDHDGCPEPDNDGDGLVDDRDACINAAEDNDGHSDLDGCPDPDNDGDRVPDLHDDCPNVAEDEDEFDDADGCPEPDNDRDGVGDAFDGAPNEPENINFFEDEDGTPETLPPLLQKVTGDQPKLRFAGHDLSAAGHDRAELLAAALLQWPELQICIQVTDPDPERAGKRALSVATVLVEMGVIAGRIAPEGAPSVDDDVGGTQVSLCP